jgi:hypothetical protein
MSLEIIVNRNERFMYEVWELEIDRKNEYIQDGRFVDAFKFLDDAQSFIEEGGWPQ